MAIFNSYVKLPEGNKKKGLAEEDGYLKILVGSVIFLNRTSHVGIPFGYVKIAIEKDHRNSGFTH